MAPLYKSLIYSHDYDSSDSIGIRALCGWVSVRVRAREGEKQW
jgi:hypothetical protein